jgi:hypothetical protein
MVETYFLTRCDKCKELVYPTNDALLLDDIVNNIHLHWDIKRHLYPTDTCEGSPSRVKNIETDPKWRETYEMIQTMTFELIDLSVALKEN